MHKGEGIVEGLCFSQNSLWNTWYDLEYCNVHTLLSLPSGKRCKKECVAVNFAMFV